MRFRRRHLPVLVLAASLAVPAVAGANDLDNGSFESGLQGWSALNARLAVKNGGPSGATFARANRRTAGEFGLVTRPGDDLQAGQSLSVRASLRAPRALQVCVRVRERRASGALVATSTRCVRATGGWQRSPALGYATRRGDTQPRPRVLRQGPRDGPRGRRQRRPEHRPAGNAGDRAREHDRSDVSGTAEQGQTLNASAGSWSGSTPMAYGYQWRRCDASGGACTNVSGATGASYALAADDVGATLRVRVTATNSVASAGVDSAQTAVVTTTTPDPDPDPDPDPGTVITTTGRGAAPARSRASARSRSRSSRRSPTPAPTTTTTPSTSVGATATATRRRSTSSSTSAETAARSAPPTTSSASARTRATWSSPATPSAARATPNPSIHQDIVQALSRQPDHVRRLHVGRSVHGPLDVLGRRRRLVHHVGERGHPHRPRSASAASSRPTTRTSGSASRSGRAPATRSSATAAPTGSSSSPSRRAR